MNRWKIYYANGLVRTSKQGPPHPEAELHYHFGVQAILQDRGDVENERLHVVSGHDAYVLHTTGYWIPIDRDSVLERYMFHRGTTASVLKGLCLTQPEFREINAQARADKDSASLD